MTLTYTEVIHNPQNQPIDKAVIWLHGLGAKGDSFVSIVPMLALPSSLAVRFVFPQAPSMPVTINGGLVMPAWYDILEKSIDRKVDTDQIARSSQAINALVQEQIAQGVPSQNIIIAGFSQGGAVAYHTVLTSPYPLAGLLALSTYFATKEQVTAVPVNRTIPIRIDHGLYDDSVPAILGQKAKASLEQLGLKPSLHHYPTAHQISATQISDIGAWITHIFNNA